MRGLLHFMPVMFGAGIAYCIRRDRTLDWLFFDTLIKKDEMMECKNRGILETLALCVSIEI